MVLTKTDDYETLYRQFQWEIPEHFNMGIDVCDKNAVNTPEKLALIVVEPGKQTISYTFLHLKRLSNKLANLFKAHRLDRGERVGILMGQSLEVAISHIAAWKIGAISIPLFTLFGEDALRFRLKDSQAKLLVTDTDNLPKIEAIRDDLPHLKLIIVVNQKVDDGDQIDFWKGMEEASDAFTPACFSGLTT